MEHFKDSKNRKCQGAKLLKAQNIQISSISNPLRSPSGATKLVQTVSKVSQSLTAPSKIDFYQSEPKRFVSITPEHLFTISFKVESQNLDFVRFLWYVG